MVLVAGVDDAGRGPVIGPLVIGGVLFDSKQIPILESMGVRDSKSLTSNQRMNFVAKIENVSVKSVCIELTPGEIDVVVLRGKRLHKLNFLEAKAMASVIRQLVPDVVYVDASDVNEKRFGRQIQELLPFNVNIISEHKADVKYPVVSAASIIAKVRRDRTIELLHKKFGDFGSGYSHDAKTRRFLMDLMKRNEPLPDIVRKSWKTIKRLRDELEHNRL